MSRFIDKFDVILLDMGLTFMFDADRFSEQEDFGATYRQLGGKHLDSAQVRRIIFELLDRLQENSRNPIFYNNFPTVRSCLENSPDTADLDRAELEMIEQVFALHEIGTIPASYAAELRQLRRIHRLGVVSNVWSKSDRYFREFARVNIRDLFDAIVFSSDHGLIKPSPQLFAKALDRFNIDRSRIVFVGDSLKRDVAGAKAIGLSSIWVNTTGSDVPRDIEKPDLAIRDLRELLET